MLVHVESILLCCAHHAAAIGAAQLSISFVVFIKPSHAMSHLQFARQ
jgi:hypothetical protein